MDNVTLVYSSQKEWKWPGDCVEIYIQVSFSQKQFLPEIFQIRCERPHVKNRFSMVQQTSEIKGIKSLTLAGILDRTIRTLF